MVIRSASTGGEGRHVTSLFASQDATLCMENATNQASATVVQDGAEIFATSVNLIPDVNMDTATDHHGSASATPIGEEFCATKI